MKKTCVVIMAGWLCTSVLAEKTRHAATYQKSTSSEARNKAPLTNPDQVDREMMFQLQAHPTGAALAKQLGKYPGAMAPSKAVAALKAVQGTDFLEMEEKLKELTKPLTDQEFMQFGNEIRVHGKDFAERHLNKTGSESAHDLAAQNQMLFLAVQKAAKSRLERQAAVAKGVEKTQLEQQISGLSKEILRMGYIMNEPGVREKVESNPDLKSEILSTPKPYFGN